MKDLSADELRDKLEDDHSSTDDYLSKKEPAGLRARILYIESCIVTIGAMGTQKEIAELICEKGADYVLALK